MANKLRSNEQPREEEAPKEKISQAGKPKEKQAPKEKPARKNNNQDRFWNDARFLKILGLFLLLFSLYLFVAFTSFLFTWRADQSVVGDTNPAIMLHASENKVENWLGIAGAMLSQVFIHKGFGVASFIFVFVFFLIGYRTLFRVSLMKISNALAYALFLLVFISVTIGFILSFTSTDLYYLAGAYGLQANAWLSTVLGKTGTGGLLAFAGLSCLVIAYNIDFKSPVSGKKEKPAAIPAGELEDELIPVEYNRQPIIERPEYEASPSAVEFPVLNKTLRDDQIPSMKEETESGAVVMEDVAQPEEQVAEQGIQAEQTPVSHTPEAAPVMASELTLERTPDPIAEPSENEGYSVELEALSSAEEPVEMEVTAPEESVPFETAPVNEERSVDTTPGEVTAADLVKEFGEFDPTLDLSTYQYPPLELLENYGSSKISVNTEELERNKNRIVETLGHYNIDIAKIKATIGPTVTLYEIVPAAGVRISKIKNLEDDIALSLSALGIRIIAPIPGKGTIGIEVPNQNPEMVSMRSVMASEKYQTAQMDLPIALGKTISNEVYVADLAKMPHLLMAGATGQGKSVGINALLVSLLYKKHPSQIKFVMVDPKKVELTLFRKIERHFLAKLPGEGDAIITDTKKVIHTLNSLCIEMDQRYDLLKDAHVRNIKEYNAKFISRRLNPNEGHRYLPYIVLVIDEFADLMMTAGKEIETPIARLAQLARAIGIHLVIATQRPSVNVITGTIKANFPGRLAFRVSSKIDSRTILDAGGAEQLIGRGDMLLSTGSDIIRVQCAFVDTPEVEKITEFIGAQRGYASAHILPEYVDENGEGSGPKDFNINERDSLFDEAARLIVTHQQGSTSLIQRKMKLGYNRAGRIIDQLEASGIVGPFEGSKAREVLIKDEYALEQHLNSLNNKEYE
jgi:S-DNA-T family DNA segregation ATPase FtsK/SpoIIIE